MPQDADTACDLSTPEVLFQSLPPAEPNIHTISFENNLSGCLDHRFDRDLQPESL